MEHGETLGWQAIGAAADEQFPWLFLALVEGIRVPMSQAFDRPEGGERTERIALLDQFRQGSLRAGRREDRTDVRNELDDIGVVFCVLPGDAAVAPRD